MLKAVAMGLVIAVLVIVVCQAVSSITYHHLQVLALRYAGATDIPLSGTERLFLSFSTFWARYFVFLGGLVVLVSVLGSIAIALVKASRRTERVA